jgi:arginine:ornithine antiporter/lysine permease
MEKKVDKINVESIDRSMGRDLGVLRLTAFAIGATLAGGVFTLSGDMSAGGAHTAAILVGWVITGIGMYGLMMCFYELNRVKPDLTSGIFSYAQAGFGEYIGFNAAWGYWISCVLANVAFATLLFASIGYFLPVFGEGTNWQSMLAASVIVWLCVFLVTRGVRQAALLNVVVVAAKVLPILVLIVAILLARKFSLDIFMNNFMGNGDMPFFDQVKSTIFTTVWVFIGIEGAVVISGRGKNTRTAGRATVIAFTSLLALYIVISILSMGVLTSSELAALDNPPMAGVLEAVVGTWGAVLVNIALIISVTGAMYTYTMLIAEGSFAPAAKKAFPKIFAKENKNGAPIGAVLISSGVVQLFLIVVVFNDAPFQAVYYISGSMIMLPYFLSAFYYLKLKVQKGDVIDNEKPRAVTWIFAVIGSIYGIWMIYASGMDYVLATALLYAPGVIIYIIAKKQNGLKPFGKMVDIIVLAVILVLAVVAAIRIINGSIVLL